ncbi:MAG: phosphonate C-P lyase system protein PhnG [Alphaproteobacteria bacterium]|nr:phosphonate C-P lyase system protein PhnG [Alphaproteobacteria bacterium]
MPNRSKVPTPPAAAPGPGREAAGDARQEWLGVLARARNADLQMLWRDLPDKPSWTRLRGPESGLIMLRGRLGGDGRPFNLGEMSVTRCSVRLGCGRVGHGYVGRQDAWQAEVAAVLDGLLQEAASHQAAVAGIIGPLRRIEQDRRERASRQAAATRAEFFTVARGEA